MGGRKGKETLGLKTKTGSAALEEGDKHLGGVKLGAPTQRGINVFDPCTASLPPACVSVVFQNLSPSTTTVSQLPLR
jgi:hypothetical protein